MFNSINKNCNNYINELPFNFIERYTCDLHLKYYIYYICMNKNVNQEKFEYIFLLKIV